MINDSSGCVITCDQNTDSEGLATLRDLLNMYICIYRSVIALYDTEVKRKHFAQRPTF